MRCLCKYILMVGFSVLVISEAKSQSNGFTIKTNALSPIWRNLTLVAEYTKGKSGLFFNYGLNRSAEDLYLLQEFACYKTSGWGVGGGYSYNILPIKENTLTGLFVRGYLNFNRVVQEQYLCESFRPHRLLSTNEYGLFGIISYKYHFWDRLLIEPMLGLGAVQYIITEVDEYNDELVTDRQDLRMGMLVGLNVGVVLWKN